QSNSSRSRIGRVRFDQERRSIAAQKIAAEIFRNVDYELDLAAREQIVSFTLGLHLPDEVEVCAVLHRVKEGSSLRALVGQKHGGGQMSRVGINREAEQGQLNQWNAKHHGEGETVAPHLREFFRNDAAQALERKFVRSFHAADLSCSIKLMKASSKLGGICCQSYGSCRNGAMARSSAAASLLLTCKELPKATACCTPGVLRSCSANFARSVPRTDQVVRPTPEITSSTVPALSNLPLEI